MIVFSYTLDLDPSIALEEMCRSGKVRPVTRDAIIGVVEVRFRDKSVARLGSIIYAFLEFYDILVRQSSSGREGIVTIDSDPVMYFTEEANEFTFYHVKPDTSVEETLNLLGRCSALEIASSLSSMRSTILSDFRAGGKALRSYLDQYTVQ